MSPLSEYNLYVKTGDEYSAGTTAGVYLTIYGVKGRSEKIRLERKKGKKPFQRDSLDKFEIKIPHVGRIDKVKIGHDGEKMVNAWFLDSVTIYDQRLERVVTFAHNDYIKWPHNFVDLNDPIEVSSIVFPGEDEPDPDQQTTIAHQSAIVFFESIREGDELSVRQILIGDNGNEYLKLKDTRGYSALHVAAREGAGSCVETLLERGADPNQATEKSKFTALHFAAQMRRSHICQVCLRFY